MAYRDIALGLASVRDAAAVAAMSRDLIETGLGWQYRRERIARMIANPDTVTLVGRDAGRVMAFAIMTFGEERAHLVLMAVRPSHQRRGLARAMIDWLVESAQVAGAQSVHVELREGNAAANALYRAAGFVETLRVAGYYSGRETAVRMMRLLRGPTPAIEWQPPARPH